MNTVMMMGPSLVVVHNLPYGQNNISRGIFLRLSNVKKIFFVWIADVITIWMSKSFNDKIFTVNS